MFKGDKIKSKPDSPDRLNRLVSGTKINGDITTISSLRVDGEIIGNIDCKGKFVLGKEGIIKGNINAIEVEIDGKVDGHISAEVLLTLHQTAEVKGDIQTARVVIEDGAQIDGNIQTGESGKKGKSFLNNGSSKVNGKKVEDKELSY